LPFTDFSFYGLSLFAVFYGLDWIATVPPTIKIAADRFGEKSNLVFGWIFAGHQIGAAFAAYGAGFSRTVYESYLPAFFIAGALVPVCRRLRGDAAWHRDAASEARRGLIPPSLSHGSHAR
jgi:hypothetical protein